MRFCFYIRIKVSYIIVPRAQLTYQRNQHQEFLTYEALRQFHNSVHPNMYKHLHVLDLQFQDHVQFSGSIVSISRHRLCSLVENVVQTACHWDLEKCEIKK